MLSSQCSVFPVFLGRALYCNHFSIPSSFDTDLLNCFAAFAVSKFAFLQYSLVVYFKWVERVSLLSHSYHFCLLHLSPHMPHPSRLKTWSLSSGFLSAWTDVKKIYKALSSQYNGPMIPSVCQLLDCLPGFAYWLRPLPCAAHSTCAIQEALVYSQSFMMSIISVIIAWCAFGTFWIHIHRLQSPVIKSSSVAWIILSSHI